MKRAAARAKKPMTRKAFVARLDRLTTLGAGGTLVHDFYEMIEPLDKEVAVLRAKARELEQVGKLLDAEIQANKGLHDRLMLALDGGRPPAGILSTLDALLPFAAVAKELEDFVPQPQQQNLLSWMGSPVLTLQHLRNAGLTVKWWREGHKPTQTASAGKKPTGQ